MRKKILLWSIVAVLISFTIFTVSTRTVSLLSLASWLSAIVIAVKILQKEIVTKDTVLLTHDDIVFLIMLGAVALTTLSYFSSIPTHYHQDEFITAYTSFTLPRVSAIDWFAAYPPVWVSQFPVLFHILQKPFFFLFRPFVWAIRISVWPYYLGILFFLYLLTKRLLPAAAKVTTVLFVFFAPMIYLSSMGLHFISSTFFFVASLYWLIAFLQTPASRAAIALGISAALSYLTYTSSYVAAPVIVISTFAIVVIGKKYHILTKLIPAFMLFFIILLPFVVYAMWVNNFFVQRIDQVNAITGSWSDLPEKIKNGASIGSLMLNQVTTALRSLIEPGITGLGGYNFGSQALFEPLSFSLFVLGFSLILFYGLWKRQPEFLTIVIAIIIPFIADFILTTQPPAFHRIALLYPLFAFVMGIGLIKTAQFFPKQKALILSFGIIALALMNLRHTQTMIDKDKTLYPQNSRLIAAYILKTVPLGSRIVIAAFPAFHLKQELVFRTNNAYRFDSEDSQAILTAYQGETLILLNPTPTALATLAKDYPKHRTINALEHIPLGDLVLFTPF